MIKPLNDNILVDLIEDEGMLSIVNDEYLVVKIKAMPIFEESIPTYLCVGAKVLTDFVREYRIGSEKQYYIRLKDIVSVQ